MSHSLHHDEQTHLRQAIISQCIWSDTYSSLKHILHRTANRLPLLVSFVDEEENDKQTILFFDRNVSNKLLFSPLRQLTADRSDQFEVYPRHCIFATTDLFKGVFEFVCHGKRCSRIFTTLEQLINFATAKKCAVVFMSRDRVPGRYTDADSSNWLSKEYIPGSLFSAQRIHRASSNRISSTDRLECLDEDGYPVFLKTGALGRFSLIATSIDQQVNQPEMYLHSTQTSNIDQLIKRLTSGNIENTIINCIRLVRGEVPDSFHCQYIQLVRRHTHDVLVGLTKEDLVIEWNLESHAPCRYATNLNDILNKLSDSWEEQLLETYIDQARSHYRESFQINMQLISTRDWAAFYQYWLWTGDVESTTRHEQSIPYQSRHRFHLIASIQDLSDDSKRLSKEFSKTTRSQTSDEKRHKKLTVKQHLFLAEMNKILGSASHRKLHRMSTQNSRPTSMFLPHGGTPFDKSEYDSNPHMSINTTKKNSRRTQ